MVDIVTRKELISNNKIQYDSTVTISTSVITNTTTTQNVLGSIVTDVAYIPYMRGQEIEFIGYRLRPYRRLWYYFDNNPIDKYVERPNIIETKNRSTVLKDLKTGNSDSIQINGATAKVLCIETNENDGNTRIYVSKFEKSNKIEDSSRITNLAGTYTGAVKNYSHSSGYVGINSNTSTIILAADANTTLDNYYTGNVITLVNGTNAGESAEIVSYVASSRTATVSPSFSNVSSSQVYSIGDYRKNYAANNIQSFYASGRGFVSGIIHIPDPSQSDLKIPTGDRIFRILDNGRNDTSAYTTKAEYRFVSNGLNLNRAQLIQKSTKTTLENTIEFLIEPTPTPTQSVTPTYTPTSTLTPTVTATPTRSATMPPTPSVTRTPSNTQTPPVTPTSTNTMTRTPGPTQTSTNTRTPNPTPGPTQSNTPPSTPPMTPPPTYIPPTPPSTPGITPSRTPGSTATRTPTRAPAPSPTPTPSKTGTPGVSSTGTPTVTPTATASNTPPSTPGITPTKTPIPITPSNTSTPTQTPAPSQSPTNTATITPTVTPPPTLTPTPSNLPAHPCANYNGRDWASYTCGNLYRDWVRDLGNFGEEQAQATNLSTWRFCDAAGNAIQGYPNLNFATRVGDWNAGYVNGIPITSMPPGTKFPMGTYIQHYYYAPRPDFWLGWIGAGVGWTSPIDVSNLWAWPLFCYSDIAFGCLGIQQDPVAETFRVDAEQHVDGIFVPSVDLFFKNKGTLPVELQIRPVENGAPSSNTIIPGAVCVLEPEDINISDKPNTENALTKTTFTFSSPVYLNSAYDYALVVITDDYGYDIYTAELGKQILGTERIVSKQPFVGSLYRSQNQRTWTPIQDEDLMFKVNMCQFEGVGTVFLNEDKTKMSETDVVYDAFELNSDAIELKPTRLNYRYKSMSNSSGLMDESYTIMTPDRKVNMNERKIIKHKSYPNTTLNMTVNMTSGNPDVSPVIFHNRQNFVAIENYINDTTLTSNNFVITNGGYDYSNDVSVIITSDVGYGANAYGMVDAGNVVSIIVDNAGRGYVGNVSAVIVGDGQDATVDVISETDMSGGPASTRYISKTVTLQDGFDAGDLRVYVTANKPAGANVNIYYKVRNWNDPEPIEKKYWTRMVQKTSEFIYSNDGEQIEYEYRPSLTSNNIVYSTNATTYKTFNQYVIKVTLSSTGTTATQIPYVYDLRAIALPEDAY